MPTNYTLYKNLIPSSDGYNKIESFMCMPNHTTPRCVVQIINGARECFACHAELCEYLTERGYIVCGHDKSGVGQATSEAETHPYAANGEKILTWDTQRMTAIIRQNLEGLPVVYVGFGEGSLIARKILNEAGAADGYILINTIGKNKKTARAKRKTASASSFGREKKSGLKIYEKLFGVCDKASCNLCGDITLASLSDLFDLLDSACETRKDRYVKKGTPILIISNGESKESPYNMWAEELYNRYISGGLADVRMIQYETKALENSAFAFIENWLKERNF